MMKEHERLAFDATEHEGLVLAALPKPQGITLEAWRERYNALYPISDGDRNGARERSKSFMVARDKLLRAGEVALNPTEGLYYPA